jgi:molybdopterin converting factor subunit 1
MNLQIRLFARVRELIGDELCCLDVPTGSTVATIRMALDSRYPRAQELITRCAMAVNCELVTDDHVVDASDEIAVIPPVSGGAN